MTWELLSFWLLLVVACVYAQRRGGLPERVVAAQLLTAAVLTVLCRAGVSIRYSSIDLGVVLIDALLLIGLITVAVSVDRAWPIPLTSLQAIAVLGHFCKLVNPELWRLGYALMTTAPAYPAVILLIVGTYRHDQRARPVVPEPYSPVSLSL